MPIRELLATSAEIQASSASWPWMRGVSVFQIDVDAEAHPAQGDRFGQSGRDAACQVALAGVHVELIAAGKRHQRPFRGR